MSTGKDKDNLDDLLVRAFRRDDLRLDFDGWKKEHSDEIRAYRSAAQRARRPQVIQMRAWRAFMGSRLVRWGLPAALVAAAAGLFCTRPGSSRGVVLGQVIGNTASIQTLHARVVQNGEEGEVWARRPNMLRFEHDSDVTEISNGATQWVVNTPFNKATRKQSTYYSQAQRRGLDVVDFFVQQWFDTFAGFMSEGPVDRITRDRRRLDVYRLTSEEHGDDVRFEALVDVSSHLLYSLSIQSCRDGELAGEFQISEITYNGAAPESLFRFEPPETMKVVVEESRRLLDAAQPAQGATLSGIVTWATSGEPVVGAVVTITTGQDRTSLVRAQAGPDGSWQAAGVRKGRVSLQVRSNQWEWPAIPTFTSNVGSPRRPEILVEDEAEYGGLNFRVHKPGDHYARITVDVKDEEGNPIRGAGAFVEDRETGTIQYMEAGPSRSQFTKGDGRFDSRAIWPTLYPARLQVGPQNASGPYVTRGVSEGPFIIEPKGTRHFDVVLPYKRQMTIRVVDPSGQPVGGIAVSVLAEDTATSIFPEWGHPLLTGADGQAVVSDMRPGEGVLLWLRHVDPCEPDRSNPITSSLVHATAPVDRRIPVVDVPFVDKPTVIEGYLHLGSDIQAGFVAVYVTGKVGDLDHMMLMTAKADPDGHFRLRGVPAGTIRLLYSVTGPDNLSHRGEGAMTAGPDSLYQVEFTEQGLRVLDRRPAAE